jgi:hypothetical protein
MKKSVGVLVTLILFTSCFCAKGLPLKQTTYQVQNHNQKASVDHSAWEKLLKKYVASNGDVDYKGFKNDASILNTYINYLASQVPTEQWSKQEQLAYFINVYNANTIKLIIDHYPTKSIKDIKNPWLKDRIKIGEKEFSLSGIEHGILRKMNEPRIHFAINCASVSCPKLLNTAFTARNVETLLEQATKDFIQNPNNNKISENRIQLSKIFQWYKGDFKDNGSLIDYVNQYSKIKTNPNAKVEYLEYNWNLNEQN